NDLAVSRQRTATATYNTPPLHNTHWHHGCRVTVRDAQTHMCAYTHTHTHTHTHIHSLLVRNMGFAWIEGDAQGHYEQHTMLGTVQKRCLCTGVHAGSR